MARLTNARAGHVAKWVMPAAKKLLVESLTGHTATNLLNDVANIEMGQSPHSDTINEVRVGVPLIGGPSDLGLVFPEPTRWTEAPTKLCRPNDIIVCVRATIGEPRWADGIYCLGRGVAGLRPATENLDTRFLFRVIQGNEQSLRAQGTGTTFKTISKKHLAAIRVPSVPLTLQNEVCDFLDWLEGHDTTRPDFAQAPRLPASFQAELNAVVRIEELAARIEEARGLRRQAVEEAEALWKSALNATFVSGVRGGSGDYAGDLLERQAKVYKSTEKTQFNNAHPWKPRIYSIDVPELPEGWIWTDLGSVLTHIVDCVNDTPDFVTSPTEFIGLKSTNIRPYQLDLSEKWFMTETDFEHWNRRVTPKPGDLLFTREAPLGNACILPDRITACLTQRIMLFRADERFVSIRYVLHFVNSPLFLNQVLEKSRGLTHPHLRVRDAPNIRIPLCSLPDQHRVVAHLDALKTHMDALRRQQAETAAELDALLPSILDKAFKGEL